MFRCNLPWTFSFCAIWVKNDLFNHFGNCFWYYLVFHSLYITNSFNFGPLQKSHSMESQPKVGIVVIPKNCAKPGFFFFYVFTQTCISLGADALITTDSSLPGVILSSQVVRCCILLDSHRMLDDLACSQQAYFWKESD